MCTAITYQTKDFYFGRTLDYDFTYGEDVTIVPRNLPLRFLRMGPVSTHYAMIGIAHVEESYPMYYEAVNEKGLGMAGLNFLGNAHYLKEAPGWDNIAPFEFIPWILSQCATLREARSLLEKVRLVRLSFHERLPLSELHWIIADRTGALVAEPDEDGLKIYDDPAGVLTNNPRFPEQMSLLNNYMNLSPYPPINRFCEKLPLKAYSRGMGALGLPGDVSSESRFVRAAFTKLNSISGASEQESVNQFFHILGSVDCIRGLCRMEENKCHITSYTCCCNGDKGIFYYTTYDNHRISAVDMKKENLDGSCLIRYPLIRQEQFHFQN